jgi:L-alanine-DL-glutamate epimerase-like enolase superfamily enzyme
VRVDTDAGITGWGEAFSYSCRRAVAAAVRDMIAPLAVGRDADGHHGCIATSRAAAYLRPVRHHRIRALGLGHRALGHRRQGRRQAALRMLGGARRERLGCYASLLRYADRRLCAATAAGARRGLWRDQAARGQRAGDRCGSRGACRRTPALLLDVNCEWSVADAIAVGRRLAPLALEWFEEPVFPPEDGAGLRAVGEACGIPIAAGENCCFETQFEALFDCGAVQYAQPSVTKLGGVTEFRKVAALSVRAGVKLRAAFAVLRPRCPRDAAPDRSAGSPVHASSISIFRPTPAVRRSAGPRRGELGVPQGRAGADPDRR